MSINGFGPTNPYDGRYCNIPPDKENENDIYDIDLDVTAPQIPTPHTEFMTHSCVTCNTCSCNTCITCGCR
jgi:hypothetical protein